MKRTVFFLAVCALFAAPVMAVPTLGWTRGDPGSTYQVWTFNDNDNPAAPEIDENPYGTAEASIVGGYFDEYVGMKGVWGNHPLPVEISLFIPNRKVQSEYKDIYLEICFKGYMTDVMVAPVTPAGQVIDFTLVADPVLVDPLNGWYKVVYTARIYPNPDAEIIYISAEGTGGFIDYISVDTYCIPAPGAVLLGGIGITVVGWLRRRRMV